MENYIDFITHNIVIELIVVVIILDTILGSFRALKEKKWNSTVGIDGIIRKAGMLVTVLVFGVVDLILDFNMVAFIPEEILSYLGNIKIGMVEVFGIMYVLYEFTSILKNMVKLDMPVIKGLKDKVETLLKNNTAELERK